jgi:thioredoxin 1
LDEATFDENLGAADTPLLVDFWAEWCGPCKMIAPVLEDIAKDHGERLQIAKLNVDDHPGVAQRYGVMSIPTLIVFSEGEIKKKIVGAKGKAQLLEELADFIG